MKQNKKIMALLLACCLLMLSFTGCRKAGESAGTEESASDATIQYRIGVVVYDLDSPEMNAFMQYYRDYLEEGFPVKFYFSNSIGSADEENEFIRSMKEQGANGIISFYGQDVQSTVDVCAQEELYYILGSGTLSDEDYEAVSDNEWFLGTVGPDSDSEYAAGSDMAEYFSKKGCSSFLILTGGSGMSNFMHRSRAQGMLERLAALYHLDFDNEIEELLNAQNVTTVDTGTEDLSITVSPGYMTTDEGTANYADAMSIGDYDAVMSCYDVRDAMEQIRDRETATNQNIMVGAVDCYCEENSMLFRDKDAFGNPELDYLQGKYSSMAGPAFAILYNAMTGHPQANSEDGQAVRLYQGFWTAKSAEEFSQLYSYTQGIYANAYSCEDLSGVIWEFNEDTTPQDLKKLTEAYTVNDVKARIGGNTTD